MTRYTSCTVKLDKDSFRVTKMIYTPTSDTSLDRIVLVADSYRPTVINSIGRHFTSCSYGPTASVV